MLTKYLEKNLRALLAGEGIEIDGSNPWDIKVHNKNLYKRVARDGTLGFGEAYMEGWWDCEQIDEFINRILNSNISQILERNPSMIIYAGIARLTNPQKISRAFQVGEAHYDLNNEFFKAMLDKKMIYTCGYWRGAKNLDQAQEAKLDMVCQKIDLKPGMKILDIGCGWGGFAKFAAEKYGAQVVGVTISREQVALAQEKCKGLPVDIRLQDYRKIEEKFDRIVSMGMFEHVGHKNYRTYMQVAHRCLKDDGIFLLHTIGSNKTTDTGDRWLQKYIFPNGELPLINQIGKSIENLFIMEDWHNFGPDYDKTLMAWHENFEKMWPKFKDEYGKKFYRMWSYYLLICAGAFRNRKRNQLWQIVLSKNGVLDGFRSIEENLDKNYLQCRKR